MLNWNATKEETDIISKIADRIDEMFPGSSRMDNMMDIEATHCNGCPLKLNDLLSAKPGDFSHDISGISANIDRATGVLQNCFLPRYAA